ncbi:MAG: class I SAM-dependent methyltransferase [Rhodovulum sp.]
MALARIGTLWIGPALSWMEQLCLASFVEHGHEVTVFGYGPIENLPAGVRFERADAILPGEQILRHAKTGSPAYHADIFRLRMIRDTGMVWADTDAYCLRPWDQPETGHFHGWISDARPLVNNGVLGLPRDSATLAAMLAFTAEPHPVPPWLSAEKRAALEARKAAGDPLHVSLMPWGVFGPEALTHFLRETGEIGHAFPGRVLYPVPFARAGITLRPNRRAEAEAMLAPDTLSIHFWGRRFRNIVGRMGGTPPEGSLVDHLLKRHRIDPAPTAHLMPPPPKATLDPGPAPDFSVFDDADVANMLLQRSETADVGAEIRAWMAGDDAPLMAHARAHRDRVLADVFEAARAACAGVVGALDAAPPQRLADIGCGYAFADLILYRRYGCDIVLIDIEESDSRHFGMADTGAGYTSLSRARAFLEANGVPSDRINTLNPRRDDLSRIATPDAVISLLSCGYHYPVSTYESLFRDVLAADGAVVLDIRKGSGGIPQLKAYGALEILSKERKHATVVVRHGPRDG